MALMPINAGDLFARIQLQSDVLSYVNGTETKTPTVYATVWANALNKGGNESLKESAVSAMSNWTFTIRYRTDVTSQHRVIYKGVPMEIVNVSSEDQYKTQLTLECTTYGSQ